MSTLRNTEVVGITYSSSVRHATLHGGSAPSRTNLSLSGAVAGFIGARKEDGIARAGLNGL